MGFQQDEIVRVLADSPKPLTLTEIAHKTRQTTGNASVCIKKLVAADLVEGKGAVRKKRYSLKKPLGHAHAASLRRQAPQPESESRTPLDPQALAGASDMEHAVTAAAQLKPGMVFVEKLAELLELDSHPPNLNVVLKRCRALCDEGNRDHLIDAVGEALSTLKPERAQMRQWMEAHLPSLIGVEGLTRLERYTAGERVAYELVIEADCMGVIECLVSLATQHAAALRLSRIRASKGDSATELDSRYRIEMCASRLTGEANALEFSDAHAEQCFFGAVAALPEYERITKSKIPERNLRKKLKKQTEARHYVVFNGGSEAELARRFQNALMNKNISVNIVLQGEASQTMSEIQAWLKDYFHWPLEDHHE